MLVDCAKLALLCNWKCDKRMVKFVFKLESQEKREPSVNEFEDTLQKITSLFQAIMRQLVRLAFQSVSAKVNKQELLYNVCM